MISSNFLIALLKNKAFYSLTLNAFEDIMFEKDRIGEIPEVDEFKFNENGESVVDETAEDVKQGKRDNTISKVSDNMKLSINNNQRQNASVDPGRFVSAGQGTSFKMDY